MLYLINHSTNPYYNHALEEYYLKTQDQEYFILWRNRTSILIGRNQNTLSEINSNYLKTNHFDVVRRLSGGGTVFCDPGNINFTFIVNKDKWGSDFNKLAMPIVAALQSLGIDAEFTGRNDITIDGKKISGNAQYHYNNRLLHHGTLLYSGNLTHLISALNVNSLKFKNKQVKSVSSRVTNILEHMNHQLTVMDFMDYIKNHVKNTLQVTKDYLPTEDDISNINVIKDERFLTWEWNYGKNRKYNFQNTVKSSFGIVDYRLTVINGFIKEATICGDFFGQLPISVIENKLILLKHDWNDLAKAFKDIEISQYISGLSNKAFINGLMNIND